MHHISGLHCDLKAAAIPASVQHVEHTRLLAQAGSRSYGGTTHAFPLSGAERECRRRAFSLSPRTGRIRRAGEIVRFRSRMRAAACHASRINSAATSRPAATSPVAVDASETGSTAGSKAPADRMNKPNGGGFQHISRSPQTSCKLDARRGFGLLRLRWYVRLEALGQGDGSEPERMSARRSVRSAAAVVAALIVGV